MTDAAQNLNATKILSKSWEYIPHSFSPTRPAPNESTAGGSTMQTEELEERRHREQMEAERTSESEAVFGSLGLNPRLFLNDVLNSVDDLTDSAFECFLQKAPELISIVGDEKAQALYKGTKSIQNLINAAKAKGFGCWERLCLKQVFAVPEGMSLSENNDSSKNLAIEVELSDMELDSELESLRKELAAAQKEHEKLHSEITLLEKGSNFRTKFDTSVAEALGVYEDNFVQESFRDILEAIPELHKKLSDMRSKSLTSVHHPLFSGSYVDTVPASNDDFSGRLEDVRDVINILKEKKAY